MAYHEAGHAIVGWFLEHCHPLLKVGYCEWTSPLLCFIFLVAAIADPVFSVIHVFSSTSSVLEFDLTAVCACVNLEIVNVERSGIEKMERREELVQLRQ